MHVHDLRRLSHAHARIENESLQRFKKLASLGSAHLSERLQQFRIILVHKSALDLNVDAVVHQSEFVLGEYSLVREDILGERPALADKFVRIACAFDTVQPCDVEESCRAVLFVFLFVLSDGLTAGLSGINP